MSEYLIIIEQAEKNYSAYAPDLPGCVATGDDLDELRQNMEGALRLHLDGILEEWHPPVMPLAGPLAQPFYIDSPRNNRGCESSL